MCAFKRHFELLLYEYLGLLVGLIDDFLIVCAVLWSDICFY